MRPIKQSMNAKQRNSKFFEYFLKNYGDSCTITATDDDIKKNLKNLYLDLAFGNIIHQDNKYLQYIYNDTRIMSLAAQDTQKKLFEIYIIIESLKFARSNNMQFAMLPQYNDVFNEFNIKYVTYSILNKGITDFVSSGGNKDYLVQITVQFNNPMNRNSKSILL